MHCALRKVISSNIDLRGRLALDQSARDIHYSGRRRPQKLYALLGLPLQVSDYQLAVESLDPDVVAFAPMVASKHPRVIAVGEGHGDLMRVSLQLTDSCRLQTRRSKAAAARAVAATATQASAPLATATANVEVDFSSSDLPNRPEFVQNDGGVGLGNHHRDRKTGKEMAPDLHDILIGKVFFVLAVRRCCIEANRYLYGVCSFTRGLGGCLTAEGSILLSIHTREL